MQSHLLKLQILFLCLDEILGENGVEMWIGAVDISLKISDDIIPALELLEFCQTAEKEHRWVLNAPGDVGSLYKIDRDDIESFIRADVFVGLTANLPLINSYYEHNGEPPDRLDVYAEYVYIAFDNRYLPKGQQSEARAQIAEIIEEELLKQAAGKYIGGAMGHILAYIDFIIFDGMNSVDIILDTAKAIGMPDDTMFLFYSKDIDIVYTLEI